MVYPQVTVVYPRRAPRTQSAAVARAALAPVGVAILAAAPVAPRLAVSPAEFVGALGPHGPFRATPRKAEASASQSTHTRAPNKRQSSIGQVLLKHQSSLSHAPVKYEQSVS